MNMYGVRAVCETGPRYVYIDDNNNIVPSYTWIFSTKFANPVSAEQFISDNAKELIHIFNTTEFEIVAPFGGNHI